MDEVKNLPTDKSEVPKSQLEMLDIIFKNEEHTKSLLEKLKNPAIATVLFFVLNTQVVDSFFRKMTSDNVLLWKTILFFVLFIVFKK